MLGKRLVVMDECLLKYVASFLVICILSPFSFGGQSWNDVSRLNHTDVARVVEVKTERDVVDVLTGLVPGQHVSISGARHSQGGHVAYPGGIVLDMTGFNKVLSVDPDKKRVLVQSGATWSDVQSAINVYGLAVKVMQSSNIFTVGGSLSANVHGRDPRFGPIIESVRSIKVALYDGSVVLASRSVRPDLFSAAIGGYGLLGVILTVELELTDNLPLTKQTTQVSTSDYVDFLKAPSDTLNLHFGRCAIAKGPKFLRECYRIDYFLADFLPVTSELYDESHIARNAFFFGLSRKYNWAKNLRWSMQKKLVDSPDKAEQIGRNQAMQPPIRFLDYQSDKDTDILQEYFVPLDKFEPFMAGLQRHLVEQGVNLLSVTLRYLPQNTESILSYSTVDMMAVVLYINIGLNEAALDHAQEWTRDLVDLAPEHGGTYYLTYQGFPLTAQFQRAYPNWLAFLNVKCRYDPEEVFINRFYRQYIEAPYLDNGSVDNLGLDIDQPDMSVCTQINAS